MPLFPPPPPPPPPPFSGSGDPTPPTALPLLLPSAVFIFLLLQQRTQSRIRQIRNTAPPPTLPAIILICFVRLECLEDELGAGTVGDSGLMAGGLGHGLLTCSPHSSRLFENDD